MFRSGSARCLVALLALAGAVLAAGTVEAQQSREGFSIFRELFRPDVFRGRDPRRPRPRVVAPAPERSGGTVYGSTAAADRNRETQASEYVVVMGDSLASQLAQGLADAFAEERPEVAVVMKTQGSSGLVRADFYDWPAEVPGLLAEENPSAVVLMLGTNDRQVLRDESGPHEVRSDRWRQLYAARVDAMIGEVRKKGVDVFIVGLPSMRLSRLSSDLEYINEILRERAAAQGAIFIDIWDGFVDEAGGFTTFGPALDGQRRRLRVEDGVHFTRTGARKLAHYVERDLIRLFDQSGPRRPLLPREDPETAPAPAAPAGRPVAGPVLPLTQPAGPVGSLAGGERSTPPNSDRNATDVLVKGLPLEPVAGRADDFRWPRSAVSIEPPDPAKQSAAPAPAQQAVAAPAPPARPLPSGGETAPRRAGVPDILAPEPDAGGRDREPAPLPRVWRPTQDNRQIIVVPQEIRGR